METKELPKPADGQLLLRTAYLSLDPYMRGRMSDAPSYLPSAEVGEVMVGGTVCRVEQSLHPDFAAGDWVLAYTGRQDYAVSSGEGLIPLGKQLEHPSRSLGVRGMPGFTACMGLLDIGQTKPGETAQGFIIFDDYGSRYGEFLADMTPWVADGKVKYIEDIVDGLERAPEAFIGLLAGENFGKLVIRVGEESAQEKSSQRDE